MINVTDILSKSISRGGTTLLNHTKMVLNMGMEIAKFLNFPEDEYENEFNEHLAMALLLHDIGKCSSNFQEYIKLHDFDTDGMEIKNEKDGWYYHNTLSWAFAMACVSGLHNKGFDITSSILYHHVVRDNVNETANDIMINFINSDSDSFNKMCEFYKCMVQYADDTFGLNISNKKIYDLIIDSNDFEGITKLNDEILYRKSRCAYMDGVNFHYNKKQPTFSGLIRAILVYCDRCISSMKYNNELILHNDTLYIRNVFNSHVNSSQVIPSYEKYDIERLIKQKSIIDTITNSPISVNVIQASAGFGKTLMGLMWYFVYKKKTMWVMPRNEIARGTYYSVISELDKMGVANKVKVGLYFSGMFQECNFTDIENCKFSDCDILITNIDTFLSSYSKNNMSTMLIDSYNGNVIFDEYHEFVSDNPMFAAFINMMYTRINYTNSKTLLLSASGFDLDDFWGGCKNTNIKYWNDIPVLFGDTKVNISVEDVSDRNPKNITDNSFTIMPTVQITQDLYFGVKSLRKTSIIHSRFIDEDRKKIVDELFSMYSKKQNIEKHSVIGTNIIGVGLDISAQTLNDGCITPEDTIQRCCGRASRFGEYDEIAYNILTSKSKKVSKYIKECYDKKLHDKWIEVLREYDGKQLTKVDLYNLRNKFYVDNGKLFKAYLTNLYETSVEGLSQMKHKSGCVMTENTSKNLSKGMTYRGENNSIYVTVKTKDGYLKPMICDTSIIKYKESSNHNKDRYDFMMDESTTFKFPNKYILKYRYGIDKKNDATTEKCIALANSPERPLLLFDFEYGDAGLYYIGNDEE